MSPRDEAKSLLKHYLSLSMPAGFFSGDSYSEMESIVDLIIDAAVSEAHAAIARAEGRDHG